MSSRNLSIGIRLAAGFGLILILLAIVAWVSLSSLAQIEDKLERVVRENNDQTQIATTMRETVFRQAIAVRNGGLMSEVVDMQRELATINDERQKYAAAEERMRHYQLDDEEKALLTKIKQGEVATQPLMKKAIDIALTFNPEVSAKVLLDEVRPAQQKWLAALDELVVLNRKQNEGYVAEALTAYHTARALVVTLSLSALFAGLVIAWFIGRSVTHPLGAAVVIARRVAAGDLTGRIDARGDDETAQLMHALHDMQEGLAEIAQKIRTGSAAITDASHQINDGNVEFSQRTEEHATSLEETASSMEELTSTVRQNADNAKQANQLARNASEIAAKGGSIVNDVVNTMSAINTSSRKIADIIGVIDSIAFQTNILALNAAVEAARAGEEGRGFAVVATEVRNLAQRSAVAAKEIKTLIGNSVDQVGAGAVQVEQAGKTMKDIVAAVKNVSDIMTEISAASSEQASGIDQVNEAIAQMDRVVQQNAALVEQATAAAESMTGQAEELYRTVEVFKLRDAGPVAGAQDARPAPAQAPRAAMRGPAAPRAPATLRGERKLPPPGDADAEWQEF